MSSPKPPQLARKLFEWHCGKANVDDLVGDLDEWFYLHLNTKSPLRAKLLYWQQALALMFSYAVTKRKRDVKPGLFSYSAISLPMFNSHLKVAFRNLNKHKYFTLINIFGLSVGMSVSLLLIAMYSYLRTYDDFHEKGDRIYTIASTKTNGIEAIDLDSSPAALTDKLNEYEQGLEAVVRINASLRDDVVGKTENIPLHGYYVDDNFFSIFSYSLTQGNPATALSQPNSLILTESAAHKLMGSIDVIGQTIEFKNSGTFQVTGILKDCPPNTHLDFEVLASYHSLPTKQQSYNDLWTSYNGQYIYVLLQENKEIEDLKKYLDFTSKNIYAQLSTKVDFSIQPLTEIIWSERYNAIGRKWELSGFIAFIVISILILLPACFNYINISIARAIRRSREIGIRKTLGSLKSQIYFQFITETILVMLLSLTGALLLFVLIRSEFQSMLVAASAIDLGISAVMLLIAVSFAVGVGILTGIFPALYFANLNPVQALKGKGSAAFSAIGMRKAFTVFQFVLSFCLVLSLVSFSRQYYALVDFDFGFQKENIVNIELQGVNPAIFENEYGKLAPVKEISFSSGLPWISSSTRWVNSIQNDSIQVRYVSVDRNYFNIFGSEFLAGGPFAEQAHTDKKYLVVNEAFVRATKLGSPEEAIGSGFVMDGDEMTVIGVLKDFNFEPSHVPVKSFVFSYFPGEFMVANMLVDADNPHLLFSTLEKNWQSLNSNYPFKGAFFEDELNDNYTAYKALLKIVGYLGLLALSVSMLGLLAMVVYTSELRIKEVSIRKILGATTLTLTKMLSRDYLKLIAVSLLIGIPLGFIIFENFFMLLPDYHINLTVFDMITSIIVLMLFGLTTIISHTLKTAKANPVDALKSE